MRKAKSVTVIPAKINKITKVPVGRPSLRRVAGYARVSTDSEEQFTSYEAQVDYYTNYINSRPDWKFVDVYTDEGISGLNTKKREGFNRMIKDALNGKIELIVTKSVSRFARNTVDSLTTVRKLKDKGVEVYFEKENIWTLDSKGELLITIMSSLAQEESRSLSENVTWGHRKRFADGHIMLPYSQFLGYQKGKDGTPEIVKEQAEIVRRIYREFLEGKTPGHIARSLTADKIPTPRGKTVWQGKVIESILQNEKYKGSALLQKSFTVDFLQKKKKVNEGEVPQYYIEHSHEAIIDPIEWEKVQLEIARRKGSGQKTYSYSTFTSKLKCGDCGSNLSSKIWHSTDKYRTVIWQCVNKYKGEKKCNTPHLREEQIKNYFITALSKLLKNRDVLIEDCQLVYNELLNFTEIDKELRSILDESEVVCELVEKCVQENAETEQNQSEYLEKYNALVERYEKLQTRSSTLEKTKQEKKIAAAAIDNCLTSIKNLDLLQIEFDDALWYTTIDYVTVFANEYLEFHFKCGHTIEVKM